MTTSDPLLQPYQLKHLTLKNRVMSTSHEPAFSEALPRRKGRHGADHDRRFGDRLARQPGRLRQVYDDRIVPWLTELADACHEHDCKVMIQITHLGRRTRWNKADWLPALSASPVNRDCGRPYSEHPGGGHTEYGDDQQPTSDAFASCHLRAQLGFRRRISAGKLPAG